MRSSPRRRMSRGPSRQRPPSRRQRRRKTRRSAPPACAARRAPRTGTTTSERLKRVRIYAHRGASRELRENTLPAFRRALELGADALETDVHVTSDGALVASHDPDGARVFGVPRRIAECGWAEVRAWGMTSLEEVVTSFPGVPINVDLKVNVAALAVELMQRLNAEEQVTLASFHSSTSRRVRALGY